MDDIREALLQILINQQGELEIQRSIMFRPKNIGLYSKLERNRLILREEATCKLIAKLQEGR